MIDYRKSLIELGAVALGHKGAFGLEIEEKDFVKNMNIACCVEYTNDRYIAMGGKDGGLYHIDNIDTFKKSRNLIKLAMLNGRSTSVEEINIIYVGDVDLVEEHEKYKIYNVNGLNCVAFEEITSMQKLVYVEFTHEIRAYVRNMK